jgi:hypothetical protein
VSAESLPPLLRQTATALDVAAGELDGAALRLGRAVVSTIWSGRAAATATPALLAGGAGLVAAATRLRGEAAAARAAASRIDAEQTRLRALEHHIRSTLLACLPPPFGGGIEAALGDALSREAQLGGWTGDPVWLGGCLRTLPGVGERAWHDVLRIVTSWLP